MITPITLLLLFHGLLAAALLGASTHQMLGVCWPPRAAPDSIFARFRAVKVASYTNSIIIMFVIQTFVGGVLLYPTYRIGARLSLEDYRLSAALGIFDLKEHFTTVTLGLLPAYWYYWRQPLAAESANIRKFLAIIICFTVWWNFLVGHFVNNIRGLEA
jgi:hypothetical protein